MNFEGIHPSSFYYDLPDSKIARYPLEDRSASKLLYYHKGKIDHLKFQSIAQLIPESSLVMFNNTRVIPARLIFQKESGARIEVFLLDPISPSKVPEEVMDCRGSCQWLTLIGNSKRWKTGTSIELMLNEKLSLSAYRHSDQSVSFRWDDSLTFSEVLAAAGKIPLPPYINREPEHLDRLRYQTIYSKMPGAVAAPTAGLHFDGRILDQIATKAIVDYVTLHVSAGTFQPINTSVADHPMHKEQLSVSRVNVENLIENDHIIAVGTTSMRTLESIYWFGVELLEGNPQFMIKKLSPYDRKTNPSKTQSLTAVLTFMKNRNIELLHGETEIFIFPGYNFKVCNGLITNYHLPGSTLIMLVAAFIGADWKKVYMEALDNEYRFLSYGDASLLVP